MRNLNLFVKPNEQQRSAASMMPWREKNCVTNLFLALLLTAVASIMLTPCSKGDDEPKYKFTDVTIAAGQTKTIANALGLSWTSSNSLIAKMEGDVLTAVHVGSATLISAKGSFGVTVKPTSTLYVDPYLAFGAQLATVKSWMSANITAATLEASSGTSSLLYSCTGSGASVYGYYFGDSGLNMANVMLKLSYSDELVDFLTERYVTVTVDKEKQYIGLVSPQKDILIVLEPYKVSKTTVWNVIYAPYTASSSTSASAAISALASAAELTRTSSDLVGQSPEACPEFGAIAGRFE